MFNFEKVNQTQKDIIQLIGDPLKTPPIEAFTGIKDRKRLYDLYFSENMTNSRFEDILTELYFYGLISFVPASIDIVDNLSDNAEQRFERTYSLEEKWRNQNGFVRLTVEGERTIAGTMIYHHILMDNINAEYRKLTEITIKLEEKQKSLPQIELKLNNFQGKTIELMAIFIAIFTFVIGNSSVFSFLEYKGYEEIISLILLVNGSLLLGIGFLLLLIKTLVFNEKVGFWKIIMIIGIPVLVIVAGMLFPYISTMLIGATEAK